MTINHVDKVARGGTDNGTEDGKPKTAITIKDVTSP